MRLLANTIGLDPAFSILGTLEVLAYGSLVGATVGAALSFTAPKMRGHWPVRGLAIALLSFGGTVLTLPDHIAVTVRPFADHMLLVLTLFGCCFLAFGLAMGWLNWRLSSPATGADPAALRE